VTHPNHQPPQHPTPAGGFHPTGRLPAAGPRSGPWPPPQPPRRGLSTGAIIAIVVGSVVAVCCLGGIALVATADPKQPNANAAGEQPVSDSSNAPKATGVDTGKTPNIAKAGSAVRDGKFEFMVTKGPDCGKTQIGGQKAQGRFCLITLSVRNIGDDARTFDDSNVQAYDASGNRYESDGVAGMYANPGGESFLEKINPNNQISVLIAFDVAGSVTLVSLELHDSLWSGGAKVALA
jgi:hypothetical protein